MDSVVMYNVYVMWQAFIFWVVDNFLKKQVRKTTTVHHTAITSNDTALKYFKAMDKVKYYKQVRREDVGSESDVLLSCDEDTESQYSQSEITVATTVTGTNTHNAIVHNGTVLTDDTGDTTLLVPAMVT